MSQGESNIKLSKIQKTSGKDYELREQRFRNLMPFKVREILLVSSLYDAFIIEEEGLISEMVIEEYRDLHLSSPPRITRAPSGKKALLRVKTGHYDLVITMSKNVGMVPSDFCKEIKKNNPELPVIQLATDADDLFLCQQEINGQEIDKVFFWNGDAKLFLAIIKYVEDKINARHDTVQGNVRAIIMIEDSIRDYSMFLPIIYTEIVRQVQRSLSEDLNEMQRLLRRRARPKILLVDNFEEGIMLYEEYKDNILGIISDVNFKYNGKADPNAGHRLVELIKKDDRYIPTLLQSTESENRKRAESIGAYFIHKNSPTLLQDFEHFLLNHLGFGDFVFLMPKHQQKTTKDILHSSTIEIARASDMQEFEQTLQKVPLESIKFHANRNDFSNWLMARGEFKLAMKLRPQKVSDFNSLDENRKYLIQVFNETRRGKHLGVMTDFYQQNFEFDSSFTRLRGQSLGGKGRGIAFIRSLLARYNLEKKYKDVNITVPSTIVIGTEEFDRFILDNNLGKFMDKTESISDNSIAKTFIKGRLSDELKNSLSQMLNHFKSPLAIRSSSLLEDSQNHPFAGMYSTYMLPNNHEVDKVRLEQLCQAIKLVYASVFYKDARAYIESTSSKIEEEKMAVVIQELVGNDYGGRFYPTFSGVAQSYNFYPVSYQDREDGIASIAVGLGYSVVGGEKVFRFSPRYPNILPDFSTPELIIDNTQRDLYVLSTKEKDFKLCEKEDVTLEKLDLSQIKNDGTLDLITSTYDRNDGVIRDGFFNKGQYLITFSGILKYDVFPLAAILQDVLEIGKNAMGCPVEIEFAVNFDKKNNTPPVFSILQIRPLVISHEYYETVWNEEDIDLEKTLIHSKKSLGNGAIDTIQDIVYVSPEKFNSSKTVEIAEEIGTINKMLAGSSSPYILIGPGRWGTQDRWLGMPVGWSQISGVKVMVETAIEEFNIRPSQGTHFFHNITSKGIGYINTTFNSKDSFINWEWLDNQKPYKELKFVKHVKLSSPLHIKLDGRSGRALILKPE